MSWEVNIHANMINKFYFITICYTIKRKYIDCNIKHSVLEFHQYGGI